MAYPGATEQDVMRIEKWVWSYMNTIGLRRHLNLMVTELEINCFMKMAARSKSIGLWELAHKRYEELFGESSLEGREEFGLKLEEVPFTLIRVIR